MGFSRSSLHGERTLERNTPRALAEAARRAFRALRASEVIGLACAALLACALLGSAAIAAPAKKMLVLGIDGLDPVLLQRFIDEGALPNFARLVAEGDFKPLATSTPPLSPVAWSTFITGMDPGGHGIYDFVHREPETIELYLSMSRAEPPKRSIEIGSWVIPLGSGRVENLRRGRAFWELLEDRGVPATVLRMPANFPPVEAGHGLSGMGTPDIRGTSGTFTFYSSRPIPNSRDISGGKVEVVRVVDQRVESKLFGPENSFRRVPKPARGAARRAKKPEYEHPDMTIPFRVLLDPTEPLARFQVQDTEFVLREGEWSDWVRVDFEAIPFVASVSAIGRFYLQQVRPDFRLYVTPLQINPESPALPISTPADWSYELFRGLGYFYTQELPADTKAFTARIFSGREFWEQSQYVLREQQRAVRWLLSRFDAGLLFLYVSSVDQGSHMLWHYADPSHPGFEDDAFLARGIRTLYEEVDGTLGEVLSAIDRDTVLIVMSDHGFGPFRRQVNLNSWLLERGYVTLTDPTRRDGWPLFSSVDWSRTRAYAAGLNSLYANVRGREKNGIVAPGAEHEALLDEIERELLALRDPRDGSAAVTEVVRPRRDHHGPYAETGPDVLVGYGAGYRSSWKGPLGEFTRETFSDNTDPWSGDHSVDHRLVPGVLIANREITLPEPALYDLTVAILDEYGIAKPPEMIGRDCLGAPKPITTGGER